MNKWEKEVQTSLLNSEAEVLKELEKLYTKALSDIKQSIKTFDAQIKSLDTVLQQGQQQGTLSPDQASQLISIRQSKVYQKEFQEALQGQVSDILGNLLTRSYQSISDYLTDSYDNAFIGTMYDLNKQGLPFIFPIDQASVTRAVLLDSKLSNGLYNALGLNVDDLKKRITQEISRGIAASRPYAEIARNLTAASGAPLSRTKTIIRTEGHRIQNAAVKDAQERAKAAGADVVKQWDATLDSLTRPDHQLLDGQIREINEPFEVNGKKADRPGEFGTPEEDCNCRCVMLTRARWALDEDELQILQERAAFFGLDKSKEFEDYKNKYLKLPKNAETVDLTEVFTERMKIGGLSGYPKSDQKRVLAILEDAPEDCKRAWNFVCDDFHILNNKDRGAYYSPRADGVRLSITSAKKGSSYQTPYQVLFHEYGHHMDYILNRRFGDGERLKPFSFIFQNNAFGNKIKEEANRAIENFAIDNNLFKIIDKTNVYVEWQRLPLSERQKTSLTDYLTEREGKRIIDKTKAEEKFCEYITSKYSLIARSDISDMFESSMKTKDYPFGIGHGRRYWNDESKQSTEAFAEMYSAKIDNAESWAVIKEYFPESVGIFEEMLKVVK